MARTFVKLAACAALGAALAVVPQAHAQGQPTGTVTASASLFGAWQSNDLTDPGDAWNRPSISAGITRQMHPALTLGISGGLETQQWMFGDHFGGADGAGAPRLARSSVSLPATLALSRAFLIGVSPTAQWAYGEHADAGDALIYGGVVSAVGVFGRGRVLGAGASVTRQFYSVKTSTFVVIDWRLGERVRIANAFPSGPLGGAGVELRAVPAAGWELAAGGVWRSDRWRLAHRTLGAGDVLEGSAIPMLLRASRTLGPGTRFDVYAGAEVANRLTYRDADGHELARRTQPATPVFALALSGRLVRGGQP